MAMHAGGQVTNVNAWKLGGERGGSGCNLLRLRFAINTTEAVQSTLITVVLCKDLKTNTAACFQIATLCP